MVSSVNDRCSDQIPTLPTFTTHKSPQPPLTSSDKSRGSRQETLEAPFTIWISGGLAGEFPFVSVLPSLLVSHLDCKTFTGQLPKLVQEQSYRSIILGRRDALEHRTQFLSVAVPTLAPRRILRTQVLPAEMVSS